MSYINGIYTNPGWVNDRSPYINKANLDDISDALEDLTAANQATTPITKGGTGATTAAQARANLGVPATSTFVNKGSNTNPVYFDANGQPVAMSVLHATDTDATTGYSMSVYKFGHTVTVNLLVNVTRPSGRLIWSYSNLIPSGYRPSEQTYGYAPGCVGNTESSDADTCGMVSINTGGTIRISEIGSSFPSSARTRYFRASITYVIA